MRLGQAVAVVAGVLALSFPPLSLEAAPHAGGHVAGFHAGGLGGFHGMHFGGFHGAHFGGFHEGFRHHHWHGGWWWGVIPVPVFYEYDALDYTPVFAASYLYYCPYPAGFYPYVQQCSTDWELVPAS